MYVNEVSFLLAEAAWRGWITGSAKDFYERGIRESMSVVNIEQDKVDSYLQSTMKNGMGYLSNLMTLTTTEIHNSTNHYSEIYRRIPLQRF